jgi:hypothetical protein
LISCTLNVTPHLHPDHSDPQSRPLVLAPNRLPYLAMLVKLDLTRIEPCVAKSSSGAFEYACFSILRLVGWSEGFIWILPNYQFPSRGPFAVCRYYPPRQNASEHGADIDRDVVS